MEKSFAHIETNKKAIAVHGWGPLNYIRLDHPELQETKDRVRSINEIYEKQVRDDVKITDRVTLNTQECSMGLCMAKFLDHKVQEWVLGQMTADEKNKSDG
jgi:hypothetical protein